MVEFNIHYQPPDFITAGPHTSADSGDRVEKPILTTKEIGGSVTEGSRFGSFLQTAQGAFRMGASRLELSTIMGGGEPGGAESYGKDARAALREMAAVTEAEFVSTHTPTQVGNLSGFNPQQRNFDDDVRKRSLDEVKRAIDFAGDVAQGGAVVVHTGEYQRNIAEQKWAKETVNGKERYQFLGYMEEPGRAATYLVDDRTGQIVSDIRKNKPIRIPKFKTADKDYMGEDIHGNKVQIKKGDWVDQDNRWIDPSDPEAIFLRVPEWNKEKTAFETQLVGWKEVEKMADWFNDRRKAEAGRRPISPEEYMFRLQMETRMLQSKGSSLFYADRYETTVEDRKGLKEALEFYKDLEERTPKEELWKLMEQDQRVSRFTSGSQFAGSKNKLPSEIINEGIREANFRLKHIREASSAADAQADEAWDTIQHTKLASEYGRDTSFQSFAEAAIHAMDVSKNNPHVKKDIFVAPENIFPEMGFGSHPEELIELVKGSREKFVQMVTSKRMPNPYGLLDTETQELIEQDNPFYRPDLNQKDAEELAKRHIKATFDTQHLGMWKKHFVPLEGETPQQTEDRFNKWYLKQIERLADSDIIGHVHMVDAMGAGHHHLPPGQGNLPIKDAIEYLKKKGYGGTIISEAHEENARFGAARQFTETWRYFGSPVYSTFFAPAGPTWGQVQNAYFGQTQPPMFIYGAYSPSNEWKLWSEVPME